MIYFIHNILDLIMHGRWNVLNKFPIWFTCYCVVIIVIVIIIIIVIIIKEKIKHR